MDVLRHFFSQTPELGIESNDLASARLTVVKRSLRDGAAGHLFQTETLRTELDFVGPVSFRMATLVLDRKGGFSFPIAMKLDHVGDASEAEAPRGDRQGRDGAHTATSALYVLVDSTMQHKSLGGQPVLRPGLFHMD